MATTTFIPDTNNQFVNWNDPARWTGGVAPNDPNLDVIIPTTIVVATGQPYPSYISANGNYSVGSLEISNNNLTLATFAVTHMVNINSGGQLVAGALTVAGALNNNSGGSIGIGQNHTLTADSIHNNGVIRTTGSIQTTGLFLNDSEVTAYFYDGLNLTAGSLTNNGIFQTYYMGRGGPLTVNVTAGGFTNLSGSTLTGGTYIAFDAQLHLNVGGIIATDAAHIYATQPYSMFSYDDIAGAYRPIEETLHSIAASGVLTVRTASWGDLTVDGLLNLNGALSATHLTVNAGGHVTAAGSIAGPIVDNGTIVAAGALVLSGPVSGSGTIEITPEVQDPYTGDYHPNTGQHVSVPLELAAAASATVIFDDGYGVLTLDDPASFTGKIKPAPIGDQIILHGIGIGAVTGYSYSGDSSGGTLVIHTAGGDTDLQFLGYFTTANFTLAAGPQHLSTDPPTLSITTAGAGVPTALSDLDGNRHSDILWRSDSGEVGAWDNGQSSGSHSIATISTDWHIAGTGDFDGNGRSDILWRGDNGAVGIWDNGQTSGAHTVATVSTDWHIAGVGDFDGNGRGDILWLADGGDVGIWDDGQTGGTHTHSVATVTTDWHVAGVGDFDGNGRRDILWRNDAGALGMWDNGEVANAHFVPTVSTDWHIAGVGDFDGNGHSDLLWYADSGEVGIWDNGQSSGAHLVAGAGTVSGGWHIANVGDFDGNGHSDILWRNDNGALAIWDNGQPSGNHALPTVSTDWHIV